MNDLRKLICILLLLSVSCSGKHDTDPVLLNESNFFAAIASNDVALPVPREGEWLFEHKEKGQSFDEYKNSNPVRLNESQNTIYLKPVGSFSKSQLAIIQHTGEYLSIYFQAKCQVLPPIADKIIPDSARRKRSDGNEQLLAPYFLNNILKKDIPSNAIVVMAITEKDLYPKNDWNFIFGLASYHERIGVCSIKRLPGRNVDSLDDNICLSRLIKIASHEIGHMFSLHHCINAMCVMNGSNSLPETDRQPNRVCSECLKKLYWNMRFNNQGRLKSLMDYFKEHELEKDYALAKADYDITK